MEAYAYFKGLIDLEITNNGVHKYKDIYNIEKAVLEASQMV